MSFLPSPEVFAAFTLASLVLIFTPGPDMTFSLGQTLTAGRARGFAAMLGAATGCLFHTMLAALGLSALLAASATAFTVVKVVGAGYLVWLAIDALRHGSSLTLKPDRGEKRPLARVYLMGVGINLLNPKVVMFFVTFLPQFVSAEDPAAGMKLLTLGLYFVALSIPTCGLLVLAADRFTAALQRSKRVMRAVDWLFAGIMGTFAVKLLFTRAN